MPNSQIKIDFKAWKYIDWPSIRVHVNGDLLEEKILNDTKISMEIPLDLMDGDHLLEIEHFGKSSKNTLVDTNGKIIKDTKFIIDRITINGYELPLELLKSCRFEADWTQFHRPAGMPDVFKQSCIIGPNGFWHLPFVTPIDKWIIDSRRQQRKEYKKTITYESYEPSTHSTVDYILTEEDKKTIQEIKELIG